MAVYTFTTALAVGDGTEFAVSSTVGLAVQPGTVIFPYAWTADPQLLEPVQDLTSPFGGGMQRLARLGSRWSIVFSSLPALGGANAQAFLALKALARANALTRVFSWPQPAFTAAIGSPAINGGGQLGTLLVVNGLTAGATIPAGTFFSFQSGPRTWLHCTTASVTADGGGNATLPIAPMLRTATSGGEGLNFSNPCIEGFIQGRTEDWTLDMLAWVGLPSFTVMEPQ